MIIGAQVDDSLGSQRLLSKSATFRANPALGYGFALVLFAIALALRFALEDVLPPGYPLITFIPAVIISAFIGGTGAGVLCAVLSFLSVWYWFIDPPGSFALSLGGAVGLGFYAFIALVDIALIAAAARSVDRLATQRAQLNTIVETVPLGIIMADLPSGKIIGGNRHWEEMFGRPLRGSDDLPGLSELIDFDGVEPGENRNANLLATVIQGTEQGVDAEVQYESAEGAKAWGQLLVRPVKEGRGAITGAVIALLDIDQQHKNRIALEEAIRAKELLLYEVNHRVKNSLQLVNSFLFLEASKLKDSEAHSAIMVARKKIDMIARIHQLLYEGGNHRSVDMKSATEYIVKDLLEFSGRDDVTLELTFSGNLMIDIRQASPLVLVMNEIITNSIKHGLHKDHPKLIVNITQISEDLEVLFTDNGPGMPPAQAGQKPGLGNEIIHGLVHQMRGAIAVESSGSGTTITLTIPINP
jgi:PAS domain S-box-containing protein